MSKMNWGRSAKKDTSKKEIKTPEVEDKTVDSTASDSKPKKEKKKKVKKTRVEFLAERYIGRKITIPENDEDFDEKRRKLYDESIKKEAFLEIVDLDPSKNKQYSEWILMIYAKGRFLMEDMGRMHEYLLLFDKCKHRLDEKKRNIKNYKDIEDLFNTILPYRNLSEEELMSNTQLLKVQKLKDAEVILDSENWKIIIPATKEAAILYGKGTTWCTASMHGSNYFKTYTQDRAPGSKLYIIIDKRVNPVHDQINHKFQFHWETNQFQNAQNRSVGNVDEWLHNRPELLDVFTKLSTPYGLKLRFKYNKNLTPEDKIIDEDLTMSELEMVEIPSGLTVRGNCDFRGCKATTIDNLYVEKELTLEGSEIKHITGSLYVGKSIKGKGCKLESLPENTKVKGSITLVSSNLKTIPKGLEVGSNLFLSNSKVTRIEPDISVEGHLYLHGVNLENRDVKIKHIGGELKSQELIAGMKKLLK